MNEAKARFAELRSSAQANGVRANEILDAARAKWQVRMAEFDRATRHLELYLERALTEQGSVAARNASRFFAQMQARLDRAFAQRLPMPS
jgi:hypothetical protein